MIEGVSDFMSDYQQDDQLVKREYLTDAPDHCIPISTLEYSTMSQASSPYSAAECSSSSRTSSSKKNKSACQDKNSEEYKRRRKLNNIAVKKSREKAKAESRHISQRLTVLTADNERLERRVEMLTQEIQFLQSLFDKIDGVPEHVQHQVAKVLQRLRR